MRYTKQISQLLTKFLEGRRNSQFLNNLTVHKEPDVVTQLLLLLNGSSGIAVGMAQYTHNLGEVVDGFGALLKDKDILTKNFLIL